MSSYIPKQPKQNRDRVEAKLDRELIRTLERYCQYLDSDRDYVIGKALEIAFKKDKAFAEWLGSHAATGPVSTAEPQAGKPERKTA
jgi:hypothetical protein